MKKFILATLLIIGFSASAEEKKETQTQIGEIIDESVKSVGDFVNKAQEPIQEKINTSPRIRAKNNMAVLLHYSPIDLVLPSKMGATFSYSSDDRNVQYELQYLRSSLSVPFVVSDLGGVTEQRISILKRNFWKDSNFNWYYGLSYNSLEVHLGNEYLAALTPPDQQIPDVDLLQIQTLGIDIGLGSRWYFENGIALGVDWVGWSQPLYALKKQNNFSENSTNQEYKDDIEKFMDLATYVPRFSVLKVSLGYSF